MEDNQIIELYRQRNEEAIKETQAKYGSYCLSLKLDPHEVRPSTSLDTLFFSHSNLCGRQPDR